MSERLLHRDVDAMAEAGVRSSQPEGIGRVAVLDVLVCWNNLGRNVVFAEPGLRGAHAVFGATLFPDDDEASQYDLDVHAILDFPELGLVVVLNHFGCVRAFRRSDLVGHVGGPLVTPCSLWSFAADVERAVAVGDRLVGSAPRSEGAFGILVSGQLDGLPDRETIPMESCATGLGEVTALAVVPSPDGPLVAVGGDATLALVPLSAGRVGRPRWEARVGFRASALSFDAGTLWAAGPDRDGAADDYDWERLRGGGYVALDPADGKTLMAGPLPDEVAWGTGGVAVVPFRSWLAAAGRTGRIHLVDPSTGAVEHATPPLAATSLGIAHLAATGRHLYCGFNRGGYRLHSFVEPPANEDGP